MRCDIRRPLLHSNAKAFKALCTVILLLGSVFYSDLPAYAAPTVKEDSVEVALGQSVVLSPDGGIDVQPSSANPDICRAEQSSNIYLTITGVALGATDVVVVSTDHQTATHYAVHVVRDKNKYARLETSIATNFPGSHVRLILDPDSEKVLVEGTVHHVATISQIIAFVESRELPRSQLICRLKARFVPCNYPCCRHR